MRASVVLALVTAATAAVLAPLPAHAATTPGPVVSLPFSTRSQMPGAGGTGSAALNTAVAQRCNSGSAIGGQQWYTFPTGELGLVFVRGHALIGVGGSPGRADRDFDSKRLALVDYASGEVLSCSGGPVNITAANRAAMVMYFDPAELAQCRPEDSCRYSLEMYANRTTGVPANDRWENAAPISAVPFTGRADNALADADGPALRGTCPLSLIPAQSATVWWRYTPTVSGDLPVRVEVATDAGGNQLFHPGWGVAKLTSAGPVKVQRALDQAGFCDNGPVTVEAGSTYLIGVFKHYDAAYLMETLVPGAEVTLHVGAPVQSAPAGVSVSRGNQQAMVDWSAAANASSSGVAGYRIRRFDAAGTTMQASATVEAAARSLTVSGLTNGVGYRFDVTALSSAGLGTPSAMSEVVTPAPVPDAPTGLSLTKDVAAGSATITWSPPVFGGGSSITGYRVARDGTDSGGAGPWSTTLAASARSQTFTLLKHGAAYTLSVQAINALGAGLRASIQVTMMQPEPDPGAGNPPSAGNPPAPAPAPAATPASSTPPQSTPATTPPAAAVTPPAVVVAPPGTAASPAINRNIRLTRVQYNAPGRDTRNNLNGEYVRLRNVGSRTVDLAGWKVRSARGTTYTFRATRLRAGASITLFTGTGVATRTSRFWGRSAHVWKNVGRDSATLRDQYGRTVDSCAWTARARSYTTC